jgi:hydrogenase maturation protease
MLDLREQLQHWRRGRTCLVAVGNVDSGDDGFGERLAERVEERLVAVERHDLRVVHAGTVPEHFVGRLVEEGFDHLVFLDAVEIGAAPGTVLLADAAEMAVRLPQVSTHRISLGLLARWVESSRTTRAWLLGVQPRTIAFGRGLSEDVQESLGLLAELLCEAWSSGATTDVARLPDTPPVRRPGAEVNVR